MLVVTKGLIDFILFLRSLNMLGSLLTELEEEIEKYNERVEDEELHIDIHMVRESMNHFYDLDELRAMIKEIKNSGR